MINGSFLHPHTIVNTNLVTHQPYWDMAYQSLHVSDTHNVFLFVLFRKIDAQIAMKSI